jgi:hypothetical protein
MIQSLILGIYCADLSAGLSKNHDIIMSAVDGRMHHASQQRGVKKDEHAESINLRK